ncbi:MAG: hypothetical protein ACRC1D_09470 [Culicoidibacterales bacterium]
MAMQTLKILSTIETYNMRDQVLFEKKAQENFWFMCKGVNGLAALFLFIVFSNNHYTFGIVLLFFQVAINLLVLPKKVEDFQQRLKIVTFKNQVLNLYVTTSYEGQKDSTVAATFKKTLQLLKDVGNEHGVKVHMMMYHDVSIFTKSIDSKGNIQTKVTPREEGCTWQSFDDYLIAVDLFKKKDHEERLRELRKCNEGFDWTNRHIFDQQ